MEDYNMLGICEVSLKYLKAYKQTNQEVMDQADLDEISAVIEDLTEIVDQNGGDING